MRSTKSTAASLRSRSDRAFTALFAAATIDRLLANPTPLLPVELPEALSSWSA